ncbi:alpha/beta hydrolase [Actinopolyspora erythraea]|uniref:Alpha/beta hydrolase n=1 Tax=Actinopolyspora erythraea TaxID=414996 RepID=A0A099D030_9ACTN|nr:alpha/beta hydrolase [Actinopolyspora erythraea]ASU79744.1 alpha/beta hydrolase [Actinopolyspora erythraea]KGI79533.1 alpha/beta hydrolase [Actinopolyspora erythraea]
MTVEQHERAARLLTTSDGTRLAVDESGSPQAPVTVVLVHGWTLTRHTWDRVTERLRAAVGGPVRIVRFDHRGHGDSDPSPPGTATIAQCADDLSEVIADRVPEGPIVLAGHSMGGMTIMALAERHPDLLAERVSGIALVATSSGGLSAPGLRLPEPLAKVFNAGERGLRRMLARSDRRTVSNRSGWMRPGLRWLLFGSRPAAADVARSAEWVAGCHPASFAGFRESLAEHERGEALARLPEVPTVILAGLSDRLCPLPHARRMSERLPAAGFFLYGGAGHMLPMERPEEVTERIADVTRAVPS